jgi:hypothetical protein
MKDKRATEANLHAFQALQLHVLAVLSPERDKISHRIMAVVICSWIKVGTDRLIPATGLQNAN